MKVKKITANWKEFLVKIGTNIKVKTKGKFVSLQGMKGYG